MENFYLFGLGIYATGGAASVSDSDLGKGYLFDLGINVAVLNGFLGLGIGLILAGSLDGHDYGILKGASHRQSWRFILTFQPFDIGNNDDKEEEEEEEEEEEGE